MRTKGCDVGKCRMMVGGCVSSLFVWNMGDKRDEVSGSVTGGVKQSRKI